MASPECQAARSELEQAWKDEQAASPQERVRRQAQARRRVALLCLGQSGPQERSGAPQPAQIVPPPVIARPPGPAPVPSPASPPPQPQAPRAPVITTCDPAGCWDSEGRRLNQMGPFLVGPRGPCNVQGGLVSCP